MIPKDLTKDVINRLKTVKGQIEGIIRMLEKGNDPEKILNQFKASENGLQKAHYLLLDEVLRKTLAIKIVETLDKCPGNCGNWVVSLCRSNYVCFLAWQKYYYNNVRMGF